MRSAWPSRVCHSSTHSPAAHSSASPSAAFSGVAGAFTPSAASSACAFGRPTPSASARLSTDGLPGTASTFTSSQTSSAEARKLNMIVVMTMWLPRRACSQAGTAAQAAPPTAAAGMASSSTAQPGSQRSSASATTQASSPPIEAWPSAPMLNSPACAASATARPVKMKLVV